MKKIRTPQVQVKSPGSYDVFHLVFYISIDTVALRNICFAMAKQMCTLSKMYFILFHRLKHF